MHLTKEEWEIFPTPVSLYNLSEINTDGLREALRDQVNYDYGLVDNGTTSYPAEMVDGVRIQESKLLDNALEIKEVIQECLNDYTNRLGLCKLQIDTSWFNKTNKGGRLELHRHEGSVISGGFYPFPQGEVSPLLFRNPILPYKMNETFQNDTPYANMFYEVYPYEGLLILFPSWLEHKTDKEIGNRFVVSFNTKYAI